MKIDATHLARWAVVAWCVASGHLAHGASVLMQAKLCNIGTCTMTSGVEVRWAGAATSSWTAIGNGFAAGGCSGQSIQFGCTVGATYHLEFRDLTGVHTTVNGSDIVVPSSAAEMPPGYAFKIVCTPPGWGTNAPVVNRFCFGMDLSNGGTNSCDYTLVGNLTGHTLWSGTLAGGTTTNVTVCSQVAEGVAVNHNCGGGAFEQIAYLPETGIGWVPTDGASSPGTSVGIYDGGSGVPGSGGMGGSVTNAPGPISWGGSPGGTNAATDGSVQAGFQAVVNQLRQLSLGLTNGFVLSVSNTVSLSTSNLNQEVTQLGVSNSMAGMSNLMGEARQWVNESSNVPTSSNYWFGSVGSNANVAGAVGTFSNEATNTVVGGSQTNDPSVSSMFRFTIPSVGILQGGVVSLDPADHPAVHGALRWGQVILGWLFTIGFWWWMHVQVENHMAVVALAPQRRATSEIARVPVLNIPASIIMTGLVLVAIMTMMLIFLQYATTGLPFSYRSFGDGTVFDPSGADYGSTPGAGLLGTVAMNATLPVRGAIYLAYQCFPVDQVIYQIGFALFFVWTLKAIWAAAYAVVSSLVT